MGRSQERLRIKESNGGNILHNKPGKNDNKEDSMCSLNQINIMDHDENRFQRTQKFNMLGRNMIGENLEDFMSPQLSSS